MVTSAGDETSGYNNLRSVISIFQYTNWWFDSDANVYVCSNASLFFSYQVAQDSFVTMGNESHASAYGVSMVDLKLTSRNMMELKNMQYVLSINKNLDSCSLLYRDDVTSWLKALIDRILIPPRYTFFQKPNSKELQS
jgi:hypothetical protein